MHGPANKAFLDNAKPHVRKAILLDISGRYSIPISSVESQVTSPTAESLERYVSFTIRDLVRTLMDRFALQQQEAAKPKKEVKLIAKGWEDFRREAIPADAPGTQLRSMQMAFYAGVTAFRFIVAELTETGAQCDEIVETLNGITKELDEFFEAKVLEGY